MVSFVAIDFETANGARSSACAVGIAKVSDGQVVSSWKSLIDPEDAFHPMNTWVHRIKPEDVVGAPTWPQLAPRVFAEIGDAPVVAHSAAFDLSVLVGASVRYGVMSPPITWACTRVFSRAWWPDLPSYGLRNLIAELDLDLPDFGHHHDPEWDALLAAQVALRGFADHPFGSWEEAAQTLRVRLGSTTPEQLAGCSGKFPNRPIKPAEADLENLDPTHPLFGETVCFTGTLRLFTRREAAQAVADVGGAFSPGVTKTTTLLVVGEQEMERLAGKSASGKTLKAQRLAEEGQPLEIIDEIDFNRLLTAPPIG